MFLNTDSKFIWLNGDFQPFDKTNIHLLSNTLHYGMGVFEGVRAYETNEGGAILDCMIIQRDCLMLLLR